MQTLLSLNQQSRNGLPQTSERGIAVAVVRKSTERALIEEYLEEIEQLCATVGAEIALRIVQERDRLDPATYIGKGKVEQLRSLVGEYAANFVIFDEGLSPIQMRNLQQMLGVKILDRTMLILDIFAQHARTLEAKTQVELAQLQYLYPRLTRLWTHLERQYGGIGTRGPGRNANRDRPSLDQTAHRTLETSPRGDRAPANRPTKRARPLGAICTGWIH